MATELLQHWDINLSQALQLLLGFLEPTLNFYIFFPQVLPLLSFPILSRGLSLEHAKESACWSIISSSTKELT